MSKVEVEVGRWMSEVKVERGKGCCVRAPNELKCCCSNILKKERKEDSDGRRGEFILSGKAPESHTFRLALILYRQCHSEVFLISAS